LKAGHFALVDTGELPMSMQPVPEAVTATLIPDAQRMNYLPATFGRYFMRGESLVYGWMRRLSKDYSGGFWHYYKLTNGGHYMAPDMGDARLAVLVDGNGYEGNLSADAAGLVASLFALNQLTHEAKGEAQDHLIEQYYKLVEFATTHPECGAISRAID